MREPRHGIVAGLAVVGLLALAGTGHPAATALASPAQAGGTVTASTTTAPDVAGSLPSVSSGARPGPDVLYDGRPAAPQLENRDPRFTAEPLLVSGTEAYLDGEYLYQDFLYDDHGANTTDPASGESGGAFAEHAGDLTYPTDRERYADNAADLVELRIAPGEDEVAYRFTLNTLLAADAPIVTLAFDTDRDATTGTDTLPRDPGAPFPGTDEVLTTWGTGAEHTAFGPDGGELDTTEVEVEADLEAAQLTVTVPRAVSDPQGTWRATLAVGLHDPDTGGWRQPSLFADDTTPGGAGPANPQPSGIFNLGFRFDEPITEGSAPPDAAQAEALADDEPTRFAHDLDFDRLAAGEDLSTVPETGTMVRLFPSRMELGDGRDLDAFPAFKGQLQPYSVYVPSGYDPADPPGLTLNMHSLAMNHWQYNGSTGVQQLGEERGHVVATPHARGTDGWYQHEAELDVFEVWNDLVRQLVLDPDRTSSAGYSMGGYATYRLATRYPDLFGTAMTTVGPPGDGIWVPPAPPTGGPETLTNLWLENARNVPFLNVVGAADELVPIVGPTVQNVGVGSGLDRELGLDDAFGSVDDAGLQSFEDLGYRYRYRVYPAGDHFALALLSYDVPGTVELLGDGAVDREPPHVTYAAVPAADDPDLGLVADHAYWISDVVLADDGGSPAKGVVDAYSRGFGVGHPETERHLDTGVGPLPLHYHEVGLAWAEPPSIETANLAEVRLDNVGSATLDVARASLDAGEDLTVEVTADADGELRLDGAFPPGTRVLRDGEELTDAAVDGDGADVPVVAGEHTYLLTTDPDAASSDPDPDADGRDRAGDTDGDGGPQGDDGAGPRDPDGVVAGAPLPATGGRTGLLGAGLLAAAVLSRRRPTPTGDA
jgi:hypothetical protein